MQNFSQPSTRAFSSLLNCLKARLIVISVRVTIKLRGFPYNPSSWMNLLLPFAHGSML